MPLSLVRRWQEFEVAATTSKRFVDWFDTYKSGIIKKSMLRHVREKAGLRRPPTLFTTNAALLRRKVDYKRNELPVFLQDQDSVI